MKSVFVTILALLYLIAIISGLFIIAFSPVFFFLLSNNAWALLGFLISLPLTTYIMGGFMV